MVPLSKLNGYFPYSFINGVGACITTRTCGYLTKKEWEEQGGMVKKSTSTYIHN